MRRLALGGLAVLAVLAAVVFSLVLATDGGRGWDGSTLHASWVDPQRAGVLERGPGEPLVDRTALARQSRAHGTLATFVQVSDPAASGDLLSLFGSELGPTVIHLTAA